MFEAKARKKLSFEKIAQELGRNEVAVAAIFYGQARASEEDIPKLSKLLGVGEPYLTQELAGFPDRGRTIDMPPKEPLIYRLFEIVQNYGYAYKAVLNEKFGDGIMSAIAFSTKVEKETDKDGNNWAVITLRGKWYVISFIIPSFPSRSQGYDSGWSRVCCCCWIMLCLLTFQTRLLTQHQQHSGCHTLGFDQPNCFLGAPEHNIVTCPYGLLFRK